jgi:hypothetical protein
MKCDNIVLVNLSTLDSQEELQENRKSLRHKNEAKGRKCILVDFPQERIPELKDKGSVGVYILSHTKDVVPSTLAKTLFEQLFMTGAEVRKISIACCRGSDEKMKPFCAELVKCQTEEVKLPQGLLVCGFAVNVTTFDNTSPFIEKEGEKFENYKAIKEESVQRDRGVATVVQAWGARDSGRPNFMYFIHDKIGNGATPTFIKEAEKLFMEQLAATWKTDGTAFINDKFNPNQKASKKIKDPEHWSWGDFANTHQQAAALYVKSVFWPKFIGLIKGVNQRSAAMWSSLDGYMKMKTAMRFEGKAFVPVGLSEYTDNPDMKQALDFVEQANASKGVRLRFLPE